MVCVPSRRDSSRSSSFLLRSQPSPLGSPRRDIREKNYEEVKAELNIECFELNVDYIRMKIVCVSSAWCVVTRRSVKTELLFVVQGYVGQISPWQTVDSKLSMRPKPQSCTKYHTYMQARDMGVRLRA